MKRKFDLRFTIFDLRYRATEFSVVLLFRRVGIYPDFLWKYNLALAKSKIYKKKQQIASSLHYISLLAMTVQKKELTKLRVPILVFSIFYLLSIALIKT